LCLSSNWVVGFEAARQVVAGLALLFAASNLFNERAEVADRAFEFGRRNEFTRFASRFATQIFANHRPRHHGIGSIDGIERGVTPPQQSCQRETDAVPVIHI
jgi:hypothetical protein